MRAPSRRRLVQLQDAEKTLSEKAIEKTVERICGQLDQRLSVTLK